MENTELLRQLYAIHSPSRGEKKMRKFIKDYIKRNIPGVTLGYDSANNIYATKGVSDSYPCVVSHIDQVQDKHERDFRSYIVDGKVFGFSPCAMEMRGLGADDKNGIWVCLQVLMKYDVMKCAFFVGEEIGCIGSSAADMSFFDDCRFVLQCDRRNGGDLITSVWGDLCSEEFLADTDYKDFGYKECDGLSTDVATLKDNGLKVSCVNMSCGYYKPHMDEEYTKLSELDNCLDFVCHIVEKCVKVYPHEQTKFGRYDGFDWGHDDDDFFGWYHGFGGISRQGGASAYRGGSYQWNTKTGRYEWMTKGEDVDEQWDAISPDDRDDMELEIGNCIDEGMEDEDIITDILAYYPYYDSSAVQGVIDKVRGVYAKRIHS